MTDRLSAGLSALTATLLAAEGSAESRAGLAGTISGMLTGTPRVCLVIDIPGLDEEGAQAIPQEAAWRDDAVGLCGAVIESGRPLSVPDMRARAVRSYRPAPSAHGIRSFEGRPLRVDETVVGALGVYSPRPHAFGGNLRRDSVLIADHIGVLLGMVAERARQVTLTEQLSAALSSRAVIDQALGIVMARRRCDRDAAFEVLRGLSNRRNVKVGALAAELVAALTGEVTEDLPNGPDPRREADVI